MDNAAQDFDWSEKTPLPPSLQRRFAAEPKWVDLAAYREGGDKAGAKFTELAADFAAAIRGMPKEDLLSQEVRQLRRALALATTAAAALLVLAIGAATAGILAYRAQQEAVAQRNRAEQTLAAATETTNLLVFDLAQGLRNVSGVPSAMVKAILDRARALQVQWARHLGAHCQQTRRTRWLAARSVVGLQQGGGNLAQAERPVGCIEVLSGEPRLRENLATADRDDSRRQLDLFNSLVRISAVSDPPEARAALERALSIIETLARDGKLGAPQQKWPEMIRDRLAKLPP